MNKGTRKNGSFVFVIVHADNNKADVKINVVVRIYAPFVKMFFRYSKKQKFSQ